MNTHTKTMTLMVTCTFGLEGIVSQELKRLGFSQLRVENGHIEFEGDEQSIVMCNLWLRCADRVYLKITQFKALDFDELFEHVKRVSWKDYLPEDAEFPISTIAIKEAQLYSKSDSQAIIKKAIVDSLRGGHGCVLLPETGSLYAVRVHNFKDQVSIYLDTSGDSLHKRAYRESQGFAPIKETLAAALVDLARWPRFEKNLWDPCCGTGTVLIEAALRAKNRAPGILRSFAAEGWPMIETQLWSQCREEARAQEKPAEDFHIFGSDIDDRMLEMAQANIEKAGVEDLITLKHCAVKDICNDMDKGVLICNPPYGERLLEVEKAERLYQEMGEVFEKQFSNWSYFVITPHEDFEYLFGRRAKKNRKLYNGGLKCYLYQYFG